MKKELLCVFSSVLLLSSCVKIGPHIDNEKGKGIAETILSASKGYEQVCLKISENGEEKEIRYIKDEYLYAFEGGNNPTKAKLFYHKDGTYFAINYDGENINTEKASVSVWKSALSSASSVLNPYFAYPSTFLSKFVEEVASSSDDVSNYECHSSGETSLQLEYHQNKVSLKTHYHEGLPLTYSQTGEMNLSLSFDYNIVNEIIPFWARSKKA